MSISLSGNNVFQVGNQTQQFVVTPSGALAFSGENDGAAGNPLQIKNAAMRNTLEQHYTNLLTESFSRLTKQGMWSALEIPSQQTATQYEDRQQIMASFGSAVPEAVSAFLEKRPAEFAD